MAEPRLLCAQVIKSKYFANSIILDAKPKAGMSYSWRSVLQGIDLVKKGMIWRVGDGLNLNIWNDLWIPRNFSRQPITLRGANLLTEVAELIDPIWGSWDVPLVKDVFWEEDIKLINSSANSSGGSMNSLALF